MHLNILSLVHLKVLRLVISCLNTSLKILMMQSRAVRYLERDELMREIAVKYPQKKKVLPPPEAEVEIVNEHEPHPHGEKVKFNVKTGG